MPIRCEVRFRSRQLGNFPLSSNLSLKQNRKYKVAILVFTWFQHPQLQNSKLKKQNKNSLKGKPQCTCSRGKDERFNDTSLVKRVYWSHTRRCLTTGSFLTQCGPVVPTTLHHLLCSTFSNWHLFGYWSSGRKVNWSWPEFRKFRSRST